MPLTPRRPEAATTLAWRSAFLLFLVLALPRLARLLYPQIWIEDEWYLNGAFLLSRGALPYRDFPLPHFPLLEALLAAIFQIAPTTIRTAEIVTAVAALAGSLLVYRIGERIAGRSTGTIAALIYATSGLLFRYHLFEREVFDVVPVLAAVSIIATMPGPEPGLDAPHPRRPALLAGLLLALAMAIKLTAFAALVAIVVQLLVEKRRHDAAVVAVSAMGALAALSGVLSAFFGSDFIVQVFAFRAVHATFPSLAVKIDEMRYTLDVAFATGTAGLGFIVWTRRGRAWLPIVLQLASGIIFLVLLNPTYWAHTGIELLPWLALSGAGLAGAVLFPASPRSGGAAGRVGRRPAGARVPHRHREARTPAWICAAGAVLLVIFVSPIRNLNWQAGDGSIDGFGYRDRAEIAKVADDVRAHTAADALVATPPIIAFAANRREVAPYAELAGAMADLTDAVHRDGLLRAIRHSPLRELTFWEQVEASRQRLAPIFDAAVASRKAAAVINYSSGDLFPIPMIDVDQRTLEAAGYDLTSINSNYEIWTPRR